MFNVFILYLFYTLDEHWISSIRQLLNGGGTADLDRIHSQQRIYLDTLHLLHKAIKNIETKQFNEPVWFAAQVLYRQYQIKHLEAFTNDLLPLATNLCRSMQQLRTSIYQACQKQFQLKIYHSSKKQQKQQNFSFLHSFLFGSSHHIQQAQNFYASKDNLELVSSIEPVFDNFLQEWCIFENTLYKCYIQAVFGNQYYLKTLEPKPIHNILTTLPYDMMCCDTLTRLLPLTLNRAIFHRHLLDIQDIQSMDPTAFIALPRLAILAGLTWLSHVTRWRDEDRQLPCWVDAPSKLLSSLVDKVSRFESQFLSSKSYESHQMFVMNYHKLEYGLTHGMASSSALEKNIYIDICSISDSILSSPKAKSFNRILCCLFKQFDNQQKDIFELNDLEDAVFIQQAILVDHLAI